MGDKRKQKRTTKKTNWENIRSWVGAILCIAVIVAVATYVAKLVPSSSAYTPGPIDVKPADGIPATPNPTNITFSDPIQLTGNPNDPWIYDLSGETSEIVRDADEHYVLFDSWNEIHSRSLFALDWDNMTVDPIISPSGNVPAVLDSAISKDNVVYRDQCNIFVYNLTSKETTAVTNDNITEPHSCPNVTPDIYNNIVVWARLTSDEKGIYAYNIADGRKLRVDTLTTHVMQVEPKIFENNVIWKEGNSFVLYEMKDRKKTILHTGDAWGTNIYKNDVTWLVPVLPDEEGDHEFTEYVYHMNTGQKNILFDNNHETQPDLFNENGLWEGLYAFDCGASPNLSLCLMDIGKGKFYQAVHGFERFLNSVKIVGRMSEFAYPPPHKFKIIFSGQPKYGLNKENIYMVEATIS